MNAIYSYGVTISVIVILVVAVVWIAKRSGRTGAEKDAAEKGVKVKDEQLKAALERPDKRTLIDRMRGGKF